MKKKKVFCLKVRENDELPWSETGYYKKSKNRDEAGSFNRVLAGRRTWSFDESKTIEELQEIEFEDES